MKRSREENIDNLIEMQPETKKRKISPTVIDLTQTTDDLPFINVGENVANGKVYFLIKNLNHFLKENKVSKLHCNEDISELYWSSSTSSVDEPNFYEDFNYDDMDCDDDYNTQSYSSSSSPIDWSFKNYY